MSNFAMQYLEDQVMDMVAEMCDQEVIDRSQDVIRAMEYADTNVNIDELRDLLADRLMCEEMEDYA